MNTLLHKITKYASGRPEAIALLGEDRQLTYQELLEKVAFISGKLIANNIKTLALMADNSPQWVVIDLACQVAGCCFIPLPLFFTTNQVRHSLDSAGIDLLLIDNSVSLPEDINQFTVHDDDYDYIALRFPENTGALIPNGTHKITFTSGSTGKPRGVCLSNQQQLDVACSITSTVTLDKPRHLCVLPLATLLENVAGVYAPLINGGCVALPSLTSLGYKGSSSIEVNKLLECIAHYQPETMILTPQLLDLLVIAVSHGWVPSKQLKMIAVGGSRVAAPVIDRARDIGLPVYEGYGLSECASVVSLNSVKYDKPGSAGKVLSHVKLKIVNDEIHVIGKHFLGYLNDPGSWYQESFATGDLGYLDESGYLHLIGRKKNILISSFGRNISPEWVESEILSNQFIYQCIVVGDDKPFCSAFIYADDKQLDDNAVQSWIDLINKTLPDYAQVRAWIRLPFPLSSKIGLLTENGRPRREEITSYFSSEINNLYIDQPYLYEKEKQL